MGTIDEEGVVRASRFGETARRLQDTTPRPRRPWTARSAWIGLILAATSAGCGDCGHDTGAADAGSKDTEDLRLARALTATDASLPPRPEVLALAQTIEAQALKEGAGPRAVELHALAGALFERTWREDGVEEDAKEAMRVYDAASSDTKVDGACDAAIASAHLAGDFAHDAETTYAELYRVMRRFAAGVEGGAQPCADRARAELVPLAAFKPADRILAAIDDALMAQGALGSASLLDAATTSGGPPKVVRIERWDGREAARVVLTLSAKATFRAGDDAVTAPGDKKTLRTFVELDGVQLGDVDRETPTKGIVTDVRAESTTTGSRVTLDLDGQAYRKVFFLVEPYRVVIDVARHPPGSGSRRAVASVVLDPGHGGNDSGAVGPTGVKEKDVTLAIAKKTQAELSKDGLDVTLTRDDDRYVTLEERTARANQSAADLFVSIHCNAAENRARHGVETYVLDTTKDDIAARVAARENATSEGANAELGSILADMRMADQATHSNRLATLMQKSAMSSLRGYDGVLDGGVHYAGFYVLVGARMPAVLFETSYVSNVNEETRLSSEDYQTRLAEAIANAIKAYREGK
jgi:N-acetylmuramoyl-L-alanine amidase